MFSAWLSLTFSLCTFDLEKNFFLYKIERFSNDS